MVVDVKVVRLNYNRRVPRSIKLGVAVSAVVIGVRMVAFGADADGIVNGYVAL